MPACTVYRIYNAAGELLYVGSTLRGHRRATEHLSTKPWAAEIARTEWEHHPDRATALAREIELINSERPLYNVIRTGGGSIPEHEEQLLRVVRDYAVAREGRDAAIRAAHAAGMPYRAIAEIVGLSFARVAQIVRAK